MPGVSIITELRPRITGSRRILPLANPRCVLLGTVTDRPLWDELWLPAAQARVISDGAMVTPTTGTPSAVFLEGLKNKHFGTLYTPDIAPDGPLHVVYKHRHRASTTFKEWKELRKSGRIVINPLDVCEVKLTAYPSLPADTAVRRSWFGVQHDKELEGYPALIETGCNTHPLGLPHASGAAAFPAALGNQGVNVLQEWWTAGSGRYPIDRGKLQRIGELLSWALAHEDRDSGLLTSTLCAARAGAVDLSTAVAELPETVGSIFKACKFILNAYIETRRKVGRLNNSKDPGAVETVANLWLQYRYGIMPNVYLIDDTLKYLAKSQRLYQTERDGLRRSLEEFTFEGWSVSDIPYVDRVFVKNRFGVDFLSPHLQTNLAVTAWELVPLSFVVDWVLNVGDLLAALSPTYGSEEEAVQYSRRCQAVVELTNPDWVGPPVRVEINAYRAWSIQDKYQEIGLSLSPAMSLKRWLDAAALSWGSFRKVFKSTLRGIR